MLDNNAEELIAADPRIRAIDDNLERMRQPRRGCNQYLAGKILRLTEERRARVDEICTDCYTLRKKIIDVIVGDRNRYTLPQIVVLSPEGQVMLFQFYNTKGLIYNDEFYVKFSSVLWITTIIDAPRTHSYLHYTPFPRTGETHIPIRWFLQIRPEFTISRGVSPDDCRLFLMYDNTLEPTRRRIKSLFPALFDTSVLTSTSKSEVINEIKRRFTK